MIQRLTTAGCLLAMCAAILSPGCSQTPTEPAPAGSYTYRSYDKAGVAIVSGWFTMIVSDTGSISGEWHFKAIGDPKNIGPQTGDGKLVGELEGTKAWIELNPQFRDNNLQLEGQIDGDRFAGKWTWISFIGVTNQGTFEATRK